MICKNHGRNGRGSKLKKLKNVPKNPKNNGEEAHFVAPKKYDRLCQNRANPALKSVGTGIFGILPGMPGQIQGCPAAAPGLPSHTP
jgi:hypothetical protein